MIKVSCVNYLNSQPFIYGLKNSSIINEIELSLDVPSVCADKLKSGSVNIGLVPVILIPELKESHIISDFCIGADGKVDTVLLLSEVPLDKIESILLDNQSRTSVVLARILAEKFWNIEPKWILAKNDFEKIIYGTTAAVMIGDKTFNLKNKFSFVYDLAGEWKKFTGLPFVFACWVSNKELPSVFIKKFNLALKSGLLQRNVIAKKFSSDNNSIDMLDYLENKISYFLDEKKRQAMDSFLKYSEELSASVIVEEISKG